MNVGEWAGVIGAAGSVLGGGGWFVARATVRAARATAAANEAAARAMAEPASRQADLAVLRASVARVDTENEQLRSRMSRAEMLIRAFARYVSDVTQQMRQQGLEPPAPPDRIEEYNRTGA